MMSQDSGDLAVDGGEREGDFYAEPQRIQCLNFLLHLAPYSDDALLVVGDKGSGKTTLLQQFIVKGGDNWRICLLDGEQEVSPAIFFREIQQELGFSLQGAEDGPAKVDAVMAQLSSLQKRGLRPIIIIDNAHLLSGEIRQFLQALLVALKGGEACASFIFVADESLLSQPWFESVRALGLHSFSLTPLSLEESVRYMRHYLQREGFPVESIAPSKMKKIFKQSQGNLGQINRLVQSAVTPGRLTALQTGASDFEEQLTMSKNAITPPKKPIKFSRILLGFLTVLLVVVIYFEDEMNEYFEPSQAPSERAAAVSPASTPSERFSEIDITPAREPWSSTDLVLPEGGDDIATIDETVMNNEEAGDEGAGDSEQPVPESDQVASAGDESGAMAAGDTSIAHPVVDADARNEQLEAEPEGGAELDSERSGIEIEGSAPDEPLNEPPVDEKEVAHVEQVADLGEGVIRRESWILEQNPEHYTLQIMSVSQEMGIAKILEHVAQKGKFAYFKYRKDGKVWYRLAYGVYPDRKSAQAQIARGLPEALGKVEPWIRRLGDVQKEINSN